MNSIYKYFKDIIDPQTITRYEKGLLTFNEAITDTITRATRDNRTMFEDADTLKTAQRLIDLDPYNARNTDATPAEVIKQIDRNPYVVIKDLLTIIEDLQTTTDTATANEERTLQKYGDLLLKVDRLKDELAEVEADLYFYKAN